MGTLVKTNGSLFPTVPSLFDDFFTKDFFYSPQLKKIEETLPMVNISETKKHYLFEVAAPGMKKEDFKVELENGKLIINADRASEFEDRGDTYTRKEFNYQQFQRTFKIPENIVDEDKVKANYKSGILTIELPKKENQEVSTAKRIEIS